MESSAVAAACQEKLVRFLAIRVISDDAHTELPREVASVMAHGGSYGVGRALRAVWQRHRASRISGRCTNTRSKPQTGSPRGCFKLLTRWAFERRG